LLAAAGEVVWRDAPDEPHRVLAGLPIRFYLMATPDPLLERALTAMGKRPRVELFNWRPGVWSVDGDEREAARAPRPYEKVKVENPYLVYLLGSLAEEDSFALTENNYFDFLAAFAGSLPRARTVADRDIPPDRDNWNAIDPAVRRALTEDSLVFLGFRLDDWAFRVLLRSIVLLKTGLRSQKGRSSIAVQIVPDEGNVGNPEATQAYLENYFQNTGFDGEVKVYWGTAQDFARDLRRQWLKRKADPSEWPTKNGRNP
jgi:hypothetical protein